MRRPEHDAARELIRYVDGSPSPFHAAESTASALAQAGYRRLDELSAWDLHAGGAFVLRGGSLVAWHLPARSDPWTGFRVAAAHTDSPNLRLKPRPDVVRHGTRQLGVEVYGGVLLNSWLDRDLGLSGRALVREGEEVRPRLFLIDRPLLRIPQLAIHLNREVNTEGLKLNPQEELLPLYGLEGETEAGFAELLGAELEVSAGAIVSWDAMCHDVTPSTLLGASDEFLSAPRLDNLFSCFTAVHALLARTSDEGAPAPRVPVVCLFDHEEVGSTSSRGAGSPLLGQVLERIVLGRGGTREDYHRAVADSACASVDMAHATHPNYAQRHDTAHPLRMNAGPVIKVNASQRYASEGDTEALFQEACRRADVPWQKWANRADLACGSTIGPITAARLGLRSVDVGCAQLAMHSARELAGSRDPALMIAALREFLGG